MPLEVTTIRRQLKPPSMHVLILSVTNQMNCEKKLVVVEKKLRENDFAYGQCLWI